MARADEIYTLAAGFSAAGAPDEAALRALCGAAEVELTKRLRRDVTAEDCGACFICAAAMLAAANYREAAGMGSVQAFRVGDVSVTPGANSARALRDAAERLMQPFCAGGLSCRGVLG
mgnify:FL=1